jgi:hypothetical protein
MSFNFQGSTFFGHTDETCGRALSQLVKRLSENECYGLVKYYEPVVKAATRCEAYLKPPCLPKLFDPAICSRLECSSVPAGISQDFY